MAEALTPEALADGGSKGIGRAELAEDAEAFANDVARRVKVRDNEDKG